jgi:hypothetical protein
LGRTLPKATGFFRLISGILASTSAIKVSLLKKRLFRAEQANKFIIPTNILLSVYGQRTGSQYRAGKLVTNVMFVE